MHDENGRVLRRETWKLFMSVLGLLTIPLIFISVDAVKGLWAGGLTGLLVFEVFLRRVISIAHNPGDNPKKIFTLFFFTYIITYFSLGGVLWFAIHKGWAFFGAYVGGLLLLKVIVFLGQWRSSTQICDDVIGDENK